MQIQCAVRPSIGEHHCIASPRLVENTAPVRERDEEQARRTRTKQFVTRIAPDGRSLPHVVSVRDQFKEISSTRWHGATLSTDRRGVKHDASVRSNVFGGLFAHGGSTISYLSGFSLPARRAAKEQM